MDEVEVDRQESVKKPVVRFHLTAERLADIEMGELLDIQDNPNDVRAVSTFMAKFMADEKGNYLPDDEAAKAVRKVTIGQLKAAFERVTGEIGETAVPNG